MAERMPEERDGFEPIPFRVHPRVFAALGADLVTNDVVAVIELVKNSYDAFARNVWVRFRDDSVRGAYLEIEDDGSGMTKDTIENVWCLVATPHKEMHPVARSGEKVRPGSRRERHWPSFCRTARGGSSHADKNISRPLLGGRGKLA